ncbi:MAG: fatty acid desaturase [Pyrinomonadaceae bacterium]
MGKVADINEVRSRKIQTHTIFFVSLFHILSIWALFTFSWTNALAALVTWWIAGSLGIGLGYHRLLTHRGFKVPKFVEYFLTICGTVALQGGPLSWVTTHRIHHAFTETDKDPHSPRNGVFWAHMGWIFKGGAQEHPPETHSRYSPDIVKDGVHQFLNKYYWMTNVIIGGILFAIGGWSMVLWGVFFRTVWGWHTTWLVNSMTHLWGTRRFETKDDSRNNAFVGILAWGEGWHNNHHAYPRSSRHGLKWYEFDFNWVQIRIMEKLGIAKDVYALDLNETKNNAVPLKKAA